ncbi:hypothetical protein LCGC14_1918410, partial [marine sediment metagenome]
MAMKLRPYVASYSGGFYRKSAAPTPLTGNQVLDQLKALGRIDPQATLVSYNPNTGEINYQSAPRDAILLDTGEYVPESEFNKLTSARQAYLRKFGVESFNVEQERVQQVKIARYVEAEALVEKENVEAAERFEEKTIEVGPVGERIYRRSFEKLTTEAQRLLEEIGLVEYNRIAEIAATKIEENTRRLRNFVKGTELNLTEAVRAGFTKAEDFFGYDVTLEDIISVQRDIRVQVEAERAQTKIDETRGRLSDFIKGDTLNLTGAVAAGFTKIEDYFGFDVTQEDILDAKPLTVHQAYNELLQQGEIPMISTLITTQGEYEKTGKIEYEIPPMPPAPPNYKGLEEMFLKESKAFQEATIKSGNFKFDYYTAIHGLWKNYKNLTPELQRKVLELYAPYALTAEGEIATKGWKLFPSPITQIGMKVYPWTPSAAVTALGPEATFVESTIEAAKYTLPAVWLLDVGKMSPGQIAINAAIDLVFLGAIVGPKAIRLLTRSDIRAVTKTAKTAGAAKVRVTVALAELKKTPIKSKAYSTVAARTQSAIVPSMKADKAFIDRLSMLKDVRPGELAKFQKLS